MVDINFLPKSIRKEIVELLHKKYPQKDFRVSYVYNPFALGYAVGYVLNKNPKKNGQIIGIGLSISPLTLYNFIKKSYEELEFDEHINPEFGGIFKYKGECYPQYNHMFQFLINDCRYKYSKNRIVRYMVNLFTKKKKYVPYNYDGTSFQKNDKEVPEKREEDKILDDRLIYLKEVKKK